MTITNGYATNADFVVQLDISGAFPTSASADDLFIDGLVTDASRMIDMYCGRYFYAYGTSGSPVTRYFNAPLQDGIIRDERMGGGARRAVYFDEDCLSVVSVTNGDTNIIPAAQYITFPYNETPVYALALKRSSSYAWLPDSTGNLERVIQVAGVWGFCDRTATDPISARAIECTHRACLIVALDLYRKRTGEPSSGVAQVTAAGIVITPQGMPVDALNLIKDFKKARVG